MKDSNKTGRKIQEQIEKFASRISRSLDKPKQKFVRQVIYGVQASRDVKLSNISRSLNEDIKLIKTENRLSRQITSKDLTWHINNELIKDSKYRIKEDTVLAIDLSDIQKSFAKKMDFLAKVWDGSEGKPGNGYWICEVVGADVKSETPAPLYSELYSHESKEFESENMQIMRAIRSVDAHVNKRGIWAIDRGGDRKTLIKELSDEKLRFVIRAKGNRYVRNQRGEMRLIPDILKGIRYTEKFNIKIDKEGYTEGIELYAGRINNLEIEGVKISLVIIRGFSNEPMMLITNVDKSAQEILEIYLTRWKCEESFRFLKHEYHLEDVRVRRYKGLRNTVALVHAVFYFLSVYLGKRLRLQVLVTKILDKAKRFFEIPSFKHYAIADGIHRLLFNSKWIPKKLIENDIQNLNQQEFIFT
jgi:hypothetical protein